jgi:gliding motility-associated-like protein
MKSKITLFLLLFSIINLLGNKIFAQTITATATPSTCANNGTITLLATDVPAPITYGIAKSPFNEPDIISSSSAQFTMLQPGDYFYGYFNGTTFVKSATTVNVANNYTTTSPTFSTYYSIFYAYCGSTDPLGLVYANLTGGNKPYNVELRDSNNNLVQQQQTQSSVSFTGVAAGNYTLKATDNCGTIVLAPNTLTVRPNVPYTNFTLGTVSQQPSASFFNVVFSTPNDLCTPIVSATVTNLSYVLGLTISDVTTASGTNVPQYYGAKNAVYKIEVQNASGGFDVFDNLTQAQAYSTVFTLPNDRSKWGIIRGTVTLCGITKTNQLDLAQYREFKQLPLSFVSISIYDDPTPAACTPPTQVQFSTNLYQSGGCQPITLDITEKGTSNTQHYELPYNFSFKLDIGKTYVVVIKDATGQVLPNYAFRNYTTSTSSKPTQTDPNNFYIDPAYFTPLAIKDKITLTDGPSSKNFGRSALVISNLTTSLGLVAPVRIQTVSGPSTINRIFTPTTNSYYTGLGNDLIPGTYKIRVTDSQCFTADYDIVLDSYFVSAALQNVTSEPSTVTCDRYIKKGQIKITAVGKRLTGNPDIITTVYGTDYAYPRLLKMPTGAAIFTTTGNYSLKGDATIDFSFTADLAGKYELALSRQNDNRLLLPSEVFANTATVPLEVLPNFPSFDLAQSGGVICPGNTTGSLTVKVNNTIGTVNYFIKKDTDPDFPATGQTSATFTGLTAGNYVIKAKTSCFEVIQPFTLKPANEIGDIIVGDNTYCTGATLNLSTIALGPVTSTVWTLPDNSIVNNPALNINNVTTANNGAYSVQVVTTSGCTFNATITVTINPNAEVAFPVFNASSVPLICQSSSVQSIDYSATATNATGITYSINPPEAGTIGAGSQPGMVDWNSSFNGTATITATASGCGASKSTNFTVIVSPRSNAADIIAEGRTICPNETGIILTAFAPTMSDPIFTWFDSNLSSATILGTGENLVVSPLTTTTYYVDVEGDNFCSNEAGNRKEVTVTVNPVATVSDITVANQSICQGETATLTATSALINPVFTWYTDAGLVNSISNVETISVSPQFTTTYYVTVEADGICAIPPPAKPVTVTVNPLPTALIAYSDPFTCNRGTATITQTGQSGGTYIGDAGLSINATSGEINLALSTPGQHTVTYEFTDGLCSNTTTTNIEISATVLPSPLPDITAECEATPTNPTIEDPCAGIIEGTTTTLFPITTQGTTLITWNFDYGNGYTQTITQNVIIKDTTAPVAPLLDTITGECSVTPIAPTATDNCTGIVTGTTTTLFPVTAVGTTPVTWLFEDGNGNSVTAIQNIIISEVTLAGTASTTCASDGSGYVLTFSVTGEAPYTATGTGAPGTWSGNTWTSQPIPAGTDYNVSIQDVNACNTLTVADVAPICCVFEVVCPTFPITTISCYDQLPTATTLTEAEFEALGNGDGIIGDIPCGVLDITASNEADPGCNGNIIRTYTVTEYADPNNNKVRDVGENTILNTSLCTQTIVLGRADFLVPTNQGSTVACAASIVTPIVPIVTDNCGNTLTPSAPIISATPACKGDVTYTYTFTDCTGNTHDWIYTYTIERTDFTMPANQGSIVACAASIVTPTVPTVTDNCGNTLTPSAPIISATPACNGDVTYTYTFTDCTGNTHDWVYTYTIEIADFTMPANQGSTVACSASIVTPTVPVVTDNCGNILTPSAPLISTTPACNGDVTYTYTFTDCSGNTHDWVYTYTIERADFTMPANQGSTVACAASIVTPTVPTVTDNCGNTLTPSAPIISTTPTCNGDVTYTYTFTDCNGNTHNWAYTYTIQRADFTIPANQGSTVACAASIVTPTIPIVTDNCGNILTPPAPIISATPACNGDVTYTYTFTDCTGNTHAWVYTYTIERADFTMPANQGSTVACAASIVTPIVPIVTDNCGNTLTPSAPLISTAPACNGDVIYTYTFTDCTGNTHDWVYTYTIERADFTMPANQGSTVACATSIVTPTVPVVTDNCGTILTPSVPIISTTPACNGDVTYTYTFTDCTGNTHDWIYTYTIERTDFTMPANQGSTVACAASIVTPIVPIVTDNCGTILTPSAPLISTTPACNGDVTYTYTFTDCIGNTHDWVYTYTIERADFTMPANQGSTVACATSIVTPTVPVVTDNCGNTLTPSAPIISATPACNGDVTYTYTFTDCNGNTHDWIYTYTINNTVAPTGTAPANLSLQCIEDIPIANVNDITNAASNCNGTIAISVFDTNNGGTGCTASPYIVTRTYTITDCGGLSTRLVQTITVIDTMPPVFAEALPANITVECSAVIPAAVTLTATDNCSTAIVTYNEVRINGNCSGSYQLQRTWTANDACGNKTTHMQVVTVADTTAPVFDEPLPAATVEADCSTIPPAVTLTATDNCGTTTVDYNETKVDGSCSSKYSLIRTWTASDNCGNQNTYTQTINVSCLAEVYNAISPNADGINDTFKIGGIDCFPNNTVEIFNRYGIAVYKKDGYDNVTNPFEGISDGRATFKRGEKLPTGTYFYTLRYDDNGKRVERSGYLYINNQ